MISNEFLCQNIILNELSRQNIISNKLLRPNIISNLNNMKLKVSVVEKIISLEENIISYNNNFVTRLLSTCLSWRPKSSFFLHDQLTLIE